MAEPLSTISLGWVSIRALAGVIAVGYSLFNKDIIGEGAKPLERLQEAVFGQFVGGLASDWANKASTLTAKQLYAQIVRIDTDSLNHDLQRAANKAQLIATLMACEACLHEIRADQRLQEKRILTSVRNLVWLDTDTQWLQAVKSWIIRELKLVPKSTPQLNVSHDEILRVFDSRLSLSPDERQTQFIQDTKEAVLADLRDRPYEKFGFTVAHSKTGYEMLENKINGGWDEFTPSDDAFIQLNLFQRNLNFSDNVKRQDKWFWLLCSYFNEEYKTNERLKAAMLRHLLIEQRTLLSGLSMMVAAFDSKLTTIEAKQDQILELLQKIQLENDREPFFAKYQGLEAKINVDKIINSKVSGIFVGRDNECATIDEFLKENKSGYFVITAKAGFGKSVLLANWVRQRLQRNETDYDQRIFIAYHFFNAELNATRSLEAGFTHLLRQISIYRAKEFPEEYNRVRDTIIGIIKDRPPSISEPLVIVMDALDEAQESIDPLLDPLPEGVFVIVSTRADRNEKPTSVGHWLNLVKADNSNGLFLSALDDNGIRKWLSTGTLVKHHLDPEDHTVDLIRQKTGGFPLYLGYLIDDIVNCLENGATHDDIGILLQHTPMGFEAYVEAEYEKLIQGGGLKGSSKAKRLFALLCVVLGELPVADVFALTGLDEGDELPQKALRWFSINGKGENQTFSFVHPLLAEEFSKVQFTLAKSSKQQLLSHCSHWKENRSTYALQHFARHLFREGAWEKLYALARDKEFILAQERAYTLESDAGLRTVQLALEAAIVTDNAPQIVEFALKCASKLSDITHASPLTALNYDFNRAVSLAKLISVKDEERGVLWLLLLAKASCRKHKIENARELINKLCEMHLPRLHRDELAIVAFVELFHMFEEQVLALQRRLLTEKGRAKLINAVLEASEATTFLTLENRIRIAFQLGETLVDKSILEEAIGAISDVQANAGDVDGAMKTLDMISDEWIRRRHLAPIAEAQARCGSLDAALDSVSQLHTEWVQVRTLSSIAQIQIRLGNEDGANRAFSAANQIVRKLAAIDPTYKYQDQVEGLGFIAAAQVSSGRIAEADSTLTEALTISRAMTYEYSKSVALTCVVRVLLDLGRLAEAIAISEEISEATQAYDALKLIAQAQLNAGNIEEAEQTIEQVIEIAYDSIHIDSFYTFIEIAEMQAAAGRLKESKLMFREIIKRNDIPAEHSVYGGSWKVALIAETQAKLGFIEDAERTFAWSLRTKKEHRSSLASAWSNVAQVQASSGNVNAALRTVKNIDKYDEYERATALRHIAQVQATTGRMAEAISTIKSIDPDEYCIAVACAIAQFQTECGMIEDATATFDEAKKAAHSIWEYWPRADAFRSIAEAQAASGNVDEAIKTAGEIAILHGEFFKTIYAQTLIYISDVEVDAGNVANANVILAKLVGRTAEISEELYRVEVLGSIAECQFRRANGRKAVRTFAEAKRIAGEIVDASDRVKALSSLAGSQVKSGRIDDSNATFHVAIETARQISNEEDQREAFVLIAQARAKSGRGEEILNLSKSMPTYRRWDLHSIAKACVEGENSSGFKKVLTAATCYVDLTYELVGMLVTLYPKQCDQIAEELRKYRLPALHRW
ncbi:MAG TPA: tetratricopeptide repeat protein [Pyrinomonadaceae bacterium]